jgi:hypothetical protein
MPIIIICSIAAGFFFGSDRMPIFWIFLVLTIVNIISYAFDYNETISQEAITAKAHYLWVKAGRPECDGKKFWYEAEQLLLTEKQRNI